MEERKAYTVINTFSVNGYNSLDECFIVCYERREDAIVALEKLLRNRLEYANDTGIDESGIVWNDKGEEWSVEALFDDLAKSGNSFSVECSGSVERFFVRHETVHQSFSADDID